MRTTQSLLEAATSLGEAASAGGFYFSVRKSDLGPSPSTALFVSRILSVEVRSMRGPKSLLAHQLENTDELKSSPGEGGDAVRAGDVCGDESSRSAGVDAVRARVVAGLKEMVVALVGVGDFEAAQEVAGCLRMFDAGSVQDGPPAANRD